MAESSLALSVLDLVPVRSDQSSADAVAASLELVQHADRLGFRRYWFAEHHNMPAVASTSPPVLIALATSRTERIRVGSGGVMLPNHSPFVVAEQFGLLEAAAPGRIDLGLGRAPGSDPVITALLRHSGPTSEAEAFPQHVADLLVLLERDGAALRLRDQNYTVRATPAAASAPELWLLGSSGFSAELAAKLGLPYVFAHHFATGPEGATARALELYRGGFQPSVYASEPRTFLTMNVSVADSRAEAEALALPNLISTARLRSGGPLEPLMSVEQAQALEMTPEFRGLVDRAAERWVIDEPAAAAARLRALAAAYDVEEVMLSPASAAHDGEDPARSRGREQTLTLLSEVLGSGGS